MKKGKNVGYQNLISKFLTGEISDDEMVVFKAWINQDPENRLIFDEENELWQEANVHTKHENFRAETAWMTLSSKLGLRKENNNSIKILSRVNFRIFIAAATIACLMAVGGFSLLMTWKKSFQYMASAPIIIITNEGEKSQVLLSDSTRIFLNSGSTLQYNGFYNIESRNVKLSGEAFFNVRTNPEKPFVVQIDKMSITATGTRFNVLSYGNEDRVETTLEEGKINVSIKDKEPINVKTGQQVVYFKHSEKVLIREVATDTYTSWKENKLRFNDTPIEEVLRRISRKYNVNFQIVGTDLLDLKYTATFIDESIEDVMKMLKSVSPITYEIHFRTSVKDKQYLKPMIVVKKRKSI
jgi:transmembrane sensor